MSISCGKSARKRGGNRYDVKRNNRASRHAKVYANNSMSPEEYRAMKLRDRKALARAR